MLTASRQGFFNSLLGRLLLVGTAQLGGSGNRVNQGADADGRSIADLSLRTFAVELHQHGIVTSAPKASSTTFGYALRPSVASWTRAVVRPRRSSVNSMAYSASQPPTRHDRINLLPLSSAVQVQASQAPSQRSPLSQRSSPWRSRTTKSHRTGPWSPSHPACSHHRSGPRPNLHQPAA